MGIANFHKFLKEKYSTAFKKSWLKTYDHVYIDINYALHYSSYGAKNEKEIYTRLYKFIENVLIELSPTKTVVLAIDGSAPLAKLLLQRKRRMNSIQDSTNFGILFTAGTNFMETLCEKMSGFIKYIEMVFCIEVEFMGDKDESELKIKYKIMDNDKNYPNDSHVVISNDADVIVMLSTLNNFKNVYIFSKIKDTIETLSICKLLELHTCTIKCTKNSNLDFAFISILFGNDYLPKLGYINFDNVWEAYKLNIINKNSVEISINRNNLLLFLTSLIKIIKKSYIDKFDVKDIFHPMYENYLDGLTWCLNTYYTGKCIRYNYMYKYDKFPHPIGLLFHISKYPNSILLNTEKFSHINQALYSILLLPKSSLHLIDSKYHDFAKKSEILHKEESKKITFGDIKTLIYKFENIIFS